MYLVFIAGYHQLQVVEDCLTDFCFCCMGGGDEEEKENKILSKMGKILKITTEFLNTVPNNKILDMTKLKAFADDKINVAQIMVSVFDRIENIVGKGENSG